MGFYFRTKVVTVLLTTAVFGFFVLFTHQTFLGDDWSWRWIALTDPGFAWTSPSTFARMPVLTLCMDLILKSAVLESYPRLFLISFFAVYALAFVNLLDVLLRHSAGRLNEKGGPAFLVAAFVFIFWPNNYEIHLWHMESVHALGVLCVATAFRAKNIFWQGLLVVLALLIYESFALLIAGLWLIRFLLDKESGRRAEAVVQARRWFLLLVVTSGLTLAIKMGLSSLLHKVGVVAMQKRPEILLSNLKSVFKTLWLIHFYKANWVYSVLVWIGLGFIARATIRQGSMTLRKIGWMILVPTLSAVPLVLATYSAQRAYFGPQVLLALVLASLVYVWIDKVQPHSVRTWAPLALIVLIFSAQWGRVFWVKNHNFEALKKIDLEAGKLMEACQSPCQLVLPPPSRDFEADYVFPEQEIYYSFLARARAPNKKIEFTLRR